MPENPIFPTKFKPLVVFLFYCIFEFWYKYKVNVFVFPQTVRFKNELERNITIKLGYANAKVTHNTVKSECIVFQYQGISVG